MDACVLAGGINIYLQLLLFFQCWCRKDVLHEGLSCNWVDLVLSVFWQSSEIPVFSEGVPMGSFVDQEVSLRVHVDINITRHVSICAFLEALGLCLLGSIAVWASFESVKPPLYRNFTLKTFLWFFFSWLWAALSRDCIKLQYMFKLIACFDVVIIVTCFCHGDFGGGGGDYGLKWIAEP